MSTVTSPIRSTATQCSSSTSRIGFSLAGTSGRWTLLLLGIYSSKVVWYDLRIFFESLRGNVLRDLLAGQAILLFPFIGIAFFLGARRVTQQPLLLTFAALFIYGAFINLLRGVQVPMFLAQDLCKLAFIPTAFLMVMIDRPTTCDRMLHRLAQIVLLYLATKLTIALLYYHGSFGLYYGGVADLYPFCYYSAKYCHDDGRRPKNVGMFAILALGLAISGQKRTVLLAAIAVISYLFATRWTFLFRKWALYLLLIGTSVISIFFWEQVEESISHRFQRIVLLQEKTSYDEDMPRLAEINLVLETLADSGVLAQMFGLGHGAAFDNYAVNLEGDELTHSVHFTPAAMLLRYGVVGILFYLVIAIAAVRPHRQKKSAWMLPSDVAVMRCYGIVAVLGSLAIYGLVDDMIIGAFLGTYALDRQLFSRNRRASKHHTQSPIRLNA